MSDQMKEIILKGVTLYGLNLDGNEQIETIFSEIFKELDEEDNE